MKRKSALDTAQIGFTFDPPARAKRAADLAGLDHKIAAAVARILKDEDRSREEVAGKMSSLLEQDVSRAMLDAYSSPARDTFNISASRFLALIAATDRFDILDELIRPIGAAVLVGEEIHAAHVGHLEAQLVEIAKQLKAAKTRSNPIERGRTK